MRTACSVRGQRSSPTRLMARRYGYVSAVTPSLAHFTRDVPSGVKKLDPRAPSACCCRVRQHNADKYSKRHGDTRKPSNSKVRGTHVVHPPVTMAMGVSPLYRLVQHNLF